MAENPNPPTQSVRPQFNRQHKAVPEKPITSEPEVPTAKPGLTELNR